TSPPGLLKVALLPVLARVPLRFKAADVEAVLRRLLQALQELGQVVLLSIFPSGLPFLLLARARFLPLARGELACARLFLDLNFLVWRARLLLRKFSLPHY